MRITRRNVLKAGGAAAIAYVTLGAGSCGKNISVYTATVIGSLKELLPLLPNLSDRIRQAISIAETFDKAYSEGKFANAATIFENLTSILSELFNAIGTPSDSVKVAIAVGGVALRAIATLLKSQSTQSKVAGVVAANKNSSAVLMIDRMADPRVIDAVVQAVKP